MLEGVTKVAIRFEEEHHQYHAMDDVQADQETRVEAGGSLVVGACLGGVVRMVSSAPTDVNKLRGGRRSI